MMIAHKENKETFNTIPNSMFSQKEINLRVRSLNNQIALVGSSRSYQTINARDASSLHPHAEESHLLGQESKKRNKRLERNRIEAPGTPSSKAPLAPPRPATTSTAASRVRAIPTSLFLCDSVDSLHR